MFDYPIDDDEEDDDDVDILSEIEDEIEADSETPQQQAQENNSGWKPYQPQNSPTIFPSSFGNSWQPVNQQSSSPWSSSLWNQNQQQTQQPGQTWGNQKQLPRNKKIVFCDLLDNVIESWHSQGKLGVPFRGIYDVRIKFEVLDRIAAIRPEYLFILSNQDLTPGTVQCEVFQSMTTWLVYSIAEYLRMPYENVKCFIKGGFDINDEYVKPNTGLLKKALLTVPGLKERYRKSDMLVLGSASGLSGQSNVDKKMAGKFGIDYIDIKQMLTFYY